MGEHPRIRRGASTWQSGRRNDHQSLLQTYQRNFLSIMTAATLHSIVLKKDNMENPGVGEWSRLVVLGKNIPKL